MNIKTHSESETVKLAQEFAGDLRQGDIILLYGDLGAGKTVFARALIRALSGNPEMDVPSPTFTLLETYGTPGGNEIWHFDLYRLENEEEMFELGWEEALAQNALLVVEWPDRLGGLKPQSYIQVSIHNTDDEPSSRLIGMKKVSKNDIG